MINNENIIEKNIEIDVNHINNFVLDTDEGTKRIKDRFHKNAVNERNEYVERQKKSFINVKEKINEELIRRANDIFPKDMSDIYQNRQNELEKLEKLVLFGNNIISFRYKLGLEFLISSIKDDISLVELNKLLNDFINIIKSSGINLSINDFKYTMFTEEYMNDYLKNIDNDALNEITKSVFERIYFECPDIIMQIRDNLNFIIKKYSKQLNDYCVRKYYELLSNNNLSDNDVIDVYLDKRVSLEGDIFSDSYYNLNVFLEKKKLITDYLKNSPTRANNFNTFVVNGTFDELDDIKKVKYIDACCDLCSTLFELAEYYRYEEIIKDLVKKFKDRAASVSNYSAKEKEISNEEKNRLKLYKEYSKACGIGFLAKKNNTKVKLSKMHINEQVKKMNKLYDEYNDLEISVKLDKNLNDASSIYDLLVCSLASYNYLEKQFISLFGEEEDFNLEKEFNRYFTFIYSPFNGFLRKINGLIDYDISVIISDKYKLLGLNIDSENVMKDNLNPTKDTASFIKLVYSIENSNLNLDMMNYIFNVKDINPDVELKFSHGEKTEIL